MSAVIEMAMAAGCTADEANAWSTFLGRFAAAVSERATAEANARSNAAWGLMCKKMVAAELDACLAEAELIENDKWALYKGRPPYTGKEAERASEYVQGMSDGAGAVVAALRARKETK